MSVRLGTSPHVTVPHDWHTYSAMGGMPRRVPGEGSSTLAVRTYEAAQAAPTSALTTPPATECHEALLEADSFEDLPGKWQAAILKPEQNRPNLRGVTSD